MYRGDTLPVETIVGLSLGTSVLGVCFLMFYALLWMHGYHMLDDVRFP